MPTPCPNHHLLAESDSLFEVFVVVCFLLGNSPASEVYMPTFQNTLFQLHRQVGVCRIHSEHGESLKSRILHLYGEETADDTSMIISKSDPKNFTNTISRNIIKISEWFKSNSLSLNIDKTYVVQFCTKTNQKYFQTSYENRQIAKTQNIKFLGIIIDSNLSWKQHIDDIIPKLNKARFAIRSVKPFMSLEVMRLIYFSYFHPVLSYGIIFWGNSVHSK
jgi:hypothetical protein